MPATKEELQERAQLVRIHEANCQIEHPTPEESAFRMATMKALASLYNMRELRTKEIVLPTSAKPSQQTAKK